MYVIKFVSDLWQVDGFLRVLYQKADRHDISNILLNVALKHHNPNPYRERQLHNQ